MKTYFSKSKKGVVYTFDPEDQHMTRWVSVFLPSTSHQVNITTCMGNAIETTGINVDNIPHFLERERASAPDGHTIVKVIGYRRIRMPTIQNRDAEVFVPVYGFAEELFAEVEHILMKFHTFHKNIYATVIQTYFRRWRARRRFSKERLRVLNELALLPPKFVYEHFPGGDVYRATAADFASLLAQV